MSFNKQQERIKVPFTALSAFVDPSVRFGLQFDRKDKAAADKPAKGSRRADAAARADKPLPAPETPPLAARAGAKADPAAAAAPPPRPSPRTPPPRSSSSTASERSS